MTFFEIYKSANLENLKSQKYITILKYQTVED